MTAKTNKLKTAVETYFAELRRIRQSGAATDERSTYTPLANLLNAIGATLKPRVNCLVESSDQGAGHPDLYLYTERQKQKGQPRNGQTPDRGVVEVKPPNEDTQAQAVRDQVSRYWRRYRLVLVTNHREFELVGQGSSGEEITLETFQLADSEDALDRALEKPRAFANRVGAGLGEYLSRALSHKAALTEPKDLAWLLASYARDGLARVEQAGESSSLNNIRSALQEALGVRFEGEQGAHFFRSTLVQTLFYGVFSAWVLWTRSKPPQDDHFRWRDAAWHLRAPVLRALFHQLSNPARLEPLDLVEVLDWTAEALNRVDRSAFFERFDEGEAVPYFYEPFLEAFDPELRKQLGVWYTPKEIVQYMVARVDHALKDDLGIADGLAADNVYILDPCCGTGAYLAEVLRRIDANLQGRGLGALAGSMVKKAARERVFGFEIMPAPFVVAHLQVGLTMQDLDAALADDGSERVGVFLTNALTGWEPTDKEKQIVAFPELEEERDKANKVKRDDPILVILGNPPYNGFAGVAVGEERELSNAYRTVKKVRRPKGQGLNELYVRFFRMAERRIAEKNGQGVVCFISNYSWLDGLSFTGMRERYLEAFDAIRIDNLHGDRIISEYAPDGRTSETVFAIRGKSPGIRIGTSIALLSKSKAGSDSRPIDRILYRDFHEAKAEERRRALLKTLDSKSLNSGYSTLNPDVRLGFPMKPAKVSDDWFEWPSLPDLFSKSFPGVQTSRDAFLVDTDIDRLKARIKDYFNKDVSDEELKQRYPEVMINTARFDAAEVRKTLCAKGRPEKANFIRFAYRPFDIRWLYWEKDTKLLDRERSDYRPHVYDGNLWFSAAQHLRKGADEPQISFTQHMASRHLIERGANMFPAFLCDDGVGSLGGTPNPRPNLRSAAEKYLAQAGAEVEDLFHHAIAILCDPAYRSANAGALKIGWPRISVPGWPDGTTEAAAQELKESAARGRELARLLNPEAPVTGVTEGTLRPEIAAIAVPATIDNRNMTNDDYAVRAGWGHYGAGKAVMPGKGRSIEREFTPEESEALGDSLSLMGDSTFDIYLNDRAFWRNVPAAVWNYTLGGYQVLKKWLSYREHAILDRPLTTKEAEHFTHTARRIAAILQAPRGHSRFSSRRDQEVVGQIWTVC